MSEISKKWLIENKYFDKEGIEENLIYSGLTANEFIEILDSYHNSMSDVSDEEIEKAMNSAKDKDDVCQVALQYAKQLKTNTDIDKHHIITVKTFIAGAKWLRSRLPNKVDVEKIIELIDAYWKFDEYQTPISTWHDKQDLLNELKK